MTDEVFLYEGTTELGERFCFRSSEMSFFAVLASCCSGRARKVVYRRYPIDEDGNIMIESVTKGTALKALTPLEIERKFLVRMPDDIDQTIGEHEVSIIEQVYLASEPGIEKRCRTITDENGERSYFLTTKRPVSFGVREEIEEKVDEARALSELTMRDESCAPIRKTRRTFLFGGRTFELDTYVDDAVFGIMEIELSSITDDIEMPPIEVIADVTGDERYSNRALSMSMASLHRGDGVGANLEALLLTKEQSDEE